MPQGIHLTGHQRRDRLGAAAALFGQLILGGLVVGCDVGEPDLNLERRGFDRPPVHVLGVAATTSYDGLGRPQRTFLTEGEITEGVTRTASVVVFFDRFMLPHRVTRQSICVRPEDGNVQSSAQCGGNVVFSEPEYNPVDRSATFRLSADADGEPLAADTVYRVSIFAAPFEEAGFFAFDGAPLERAYSFDFRTQPDGGDEQEESTASLQDLCEIVCFADCLGDDACEQACGPECQAGGVCTNDTLVVGRQTIDDTLFSTCAFGQCHAAGTSSSLIAMGLDLSNRFYIEATAIGKTAHQSQQGESSATGDQSPLRFGRAMPIIDPGRPGNSFMLYKLLINPLNYRRAGLERDVGTFQAEIDRLRKAVVAGLPMPAQSAGGPATAVFDSTTDPDGSRSFAHMLLMAAWIANGAPLECP